MRTTFIVVFMGAVVSGCLAIAQTSAPAQPSPAPSAPPKWASSSPLSSYIGVNVQEIDSERAKALKLREEAGVEITRVTPDSPADKAGLNNL